MTRYQYRVTPIRRLRSFVALVLLFTFIGLLFFASGYLDDLARMHAGTFVPRLIEELTGALSVLVLLPGIAYVARRWPITRETWPARVPIAAAAAVLYTLAHTTLMALSRAILFPLAGQGRYDYGIMRYRYPMEGAKDVIAFAIVTGIFYFLARIERGRAAELAAADLQAKLAQAQLENLRLQLHPHFLFNTLNAISSVMYEDVAKADAMLTKLSDFLRIVLNSSGVQNVPIGEELAVERMYVDIMRTRLERQLALRIAVADGPNDTVIPFMLLQPLLENSIRHGLPAERGLDIAIDVARTGGRVVIDVTDNGTGYAPGAAGIGLRNVESRLRRTFGPQAAFSIEPRAAGGTHVRLSYPTPSAALT